MSASLPRPVPGFVPSGRYSRQELFSGIGPAGQERLGRARVLVVGCGALGSALAEMMVRAGLGQVTVADRDYVEPSNLQRQSLFEEEDAARGLPKAVAAEARLRRINSEVDVRGVVTDVAADTVDDLVRGMDLVLDGTDNFETRFLLNDVCVRENVPWVYGACVGAHGLALLVRPRISPCLRCLLGEKPAPGSGPTCDTAGVIAPIVHVVAGIQAAEALKLLAGHAESLLAGLVTVDLWEGLFEVMDLRGQPPSCPACTAGRYDSLEAGAPAVLCGRDAVQVRATPGAHVDLRSLAARLTAVGEVKANEYLVRFRTFDAELVVFADGRAIVKGVADPTEARRIYAKYVGGVMNGRGHTLVQVPPGVQCFVGEEARRRRRIEDVAVSVFEGWDYEEIIPPLFDYADVFASRALAARTYSFLGRDGSLLALRPDFTSLLAKIAAGRLRDRPAPIRLYYSGEVLRYEPPKAGRQSELYQMGLEHLGGERAIADVEVLAVAAECLAALDVRDWVLAVGHVGIFGGLTAGLDGVDLETLRERVEGKDPVGVGEALAAGGVTEPLASAIERLTSLAGDKTVLEEAARAFAFCAPARVAVEELHQTVRTLEDAGLGQHVTVDLGEVRGLDYYTGLVFRAYAPGLGFEVGGGGRYDALLARFGRPMPAVGFMLGLDRVALLLDRQGKGTPAPTRNVEPVEASGDPGRALLRARQRREAGVRVRLGSGGSPSGGSL